MDAKSESGVYCTSDELLREAKRAAALNLHLKRKQSPQSFGAKRATIRGRGMEFFESRPYVQQDEMRSIDWKVSARFDNLYTKVYIEERNWPIYLLVDLKSSMFFGSVNCLKSVLAARLSARLAYAGLNGGDYMGGLIFSDHEIHDCPLSSSQKSFARFLGQLSLATQRLDCKKAASLSFWPSVLKRTINRVPAGSVVFFISDFMGFHEQALLFSLKRKADVFALMISDPLEEALPQIGSVGMAFNHEKVMFNSNNKSLIHRYEQWRKDELNRLTSLFATVGIPLIGFSTGDNLDHGLRKLFAGRW